LSIGPLRFFVCFVVLVLVGFVVVADKPGVARRVGEALGDGVLVVSVRGHVFDSGFPEEFGVWRIGDVGRVFGVRVFRWGCKG